MIKKIFMALLVLVSFAGCSGETEKEEMPVNYYSYENRENTDLIADSGVEESGKVVESGEVELPTEEELGEYQEILLEGDVMDGANAGWVVSISLKDITVNTYNELTTYAFEGKGANCTEHIKPGDAVIVYYNEHEDGTKGAYDVGRVRMEDGAATRDEIAAGYEKLMENENGE